jgi:hypothetical protein
VNVHFSNGLDLAKTEKIIGLNKIQEYQQRYNSLMSRVSLPKSLSPIEYKNLIRRRGRPKAIL